MSAELSDRRVLGALRFTDAVTALPIDAPLSVSAPGVRWIRNRRAQWVIASAPGLAEHETRFLAPPAAPPLGDVTVVSVEAGGETLRMVLPESAASGLEPGQPAAVVLDPTKFHIFRASSGQVIA